jgi:hypothetical protein
LIVLKEIREQGRSEGFTDFETELLLKMYLEKGLGRAKARYILYDKPYAERRKNLLEEQTAKSENDYNNVLSIPPSDYDIVVPEQVLEEETKQLAQPEQKPGNEELEGKELETNYGVNYLILRLENSRVICNLDQALTGKKEFRREV